MNDQGISVREGITDSSVVGDDLKRVIGEPGVF